MPLTLDQLQAQLDALKTAMANSVTEVVHGDTRVQYRSLADISTAIGFVQQDMATLGQDPPLRSILVTTSKGL